MANWRATGAKAQFSGLLTAAETEGPQLIHRRNQTYVVTTQEEMERRFQEGREGKRRSFISVWETLAPPFSERYDVTIERDAQGNRWVNFGDSD